MSTDAALNASSPQKVSIPFFEFVAQVATMSALVALALDAMLPALPVIGQDLNFESVNDSQLVIGYMFLGMALGPLVFGPLSDSIGRKKAIYFSLITFILGSALCLYAQDYSSMMAGRVLEGLGASGGRIVAMAMVRDLYRGDAMARVLSFVTAVFIAAPALAPTIGQWVLNFSDWRGIFILFLGLALIVLVWVSIRQPETLNEEDRKPLKLSLILHSFWQVVTDKRSSGFSIAVGMLFGSFVGFLSSCQQVFQDIYLTGQNFPYYFAVLALGFGSASLLNAKLVMKFGMWNVAHTAVRLLVVVCLAMVLAMFVFEAHPTLWIFMGFSLMSFMAVGMAFGNLTALAMEPLGKMAGLGAAIVSAISTLVALPVGIIIGQSFNMTIYPIVIGFGILSFAAWLIMNWAAAAKSKFE